MDHIEDGEKDRDFSIHVEIPIVKRKATCDFCGQGNRDCFNAPNSANGRPGGVDICYFCVAAMLEHNPAVFAYRTAPAEPEAASPAAPVADQPRQKRAYKKRAAKEDKPRKRGGMGCDTCGSKGPRHKKGCPLDKSSGKSKGARYFKNKQGQDERGNEEWQRMNAIENWKPPVTPEQFGLVRDCLYSEMSALEASGQLDIPLQQVNFIYQSKTYAQYEKLAREDAGMNG